MNEVYGWMNSSIPTSGCSPTMTGYGYPRHNAPDYSEPKRGIAGKIVNSESEIMPGDVPMTGELALFPLSDGSKIFAKKWTSMGTIETLIFTNSNTSNDKDVIAIINQRLDKLEHASRNKKPYYKNKPKKEVNENGT